VNQAPTVLNLRFELDHPALRLGVVQAAGVTCGPSAEGLLEALNHAEAELRRDPTQYPEAVRGAIRDVLRKFGYKPTGRGKPASEFLLGAALEGAVPRINNLVDTNNVASLRHAHPISIFDAALLGRDVSIRLGRESEAYVFNASGQSMDIRGLPVICRGPEAEAVGNAVKDSMSCKVHAGTREVVAVVYGTRALPERALEATCTELASLLSMHAGAAATSVQLVP